MAYILILYILFQFEKVTEIHSIDIGNEGSAFVEVLVGKSTATSEQDYEVPYKINDFSILKVMSL